MIRTSKPLLGQAGSLAFTLTGVFVGAAIGFAYLVIMLFNDVPRKRKREQRGKREDSGLGGGPER